MCGFAGQFVYDPAAGRADSQRVGAMAQRLGHRGPDEATEWTSPDGRCSMAFRRLAVIDPAGSHQPMSTPDGRYTLAFNGEIYNFNTLKQNLAQKGVEFRSQGDTEALLGWLADRQEDGLGDVLGMFALALYDAKEAGLLLARDRLGQKPLWYADTGNSLVFASEAKALLAWRGLGRQIHSESIVHYMTMGYVPNPQSAWQGIAKLRPGCFLRVGSSVGPAKAYWQLGVGQSAQAGKSELGQPGQAVRDALRGAVSDRLVADVPLGLLLSGGIDSAVTALVMREVLGRDATISSFTASFADDSSYNEAPLAEQVATHLDLSHRTLAIAPPSMADLEEIVARFDEPFADSSAIPTYLVCRAAREHVTVALTGDGGDEAFGGYDRYRAMQLASTMGPVMYVAMRIAAGVIGPFAPAGQRSRLRRLVRFVEGLGLAPGIQYLKYRAMFMANEMARLFEPEFLESLDSDCCEQWFCGVYEQADCVSDEAQAAQLHDVATYLPDDLLVKADICSMASSLELRSPFLDHRVMELGVSLPARLKISGRRGKRILRDLFAGKLPRSVVEAPKRGFGVPLARWFREDLAEGLQETLLDESFLNAGVIRPEAVAGLLNDHLSGRRDHEHRLWALWVLARWLRGRSL